MFEDAHACDILCDVALRVYRKFAFAYIDADVAGYWRAKEEILARWDAALIIVDTIREVCGCGWRPEEIDNEIRRERCKYYRERGWVPPRDRCPGA